VRGSGQKAESVSRLVRRAGAGIIDYETRHLCPYTRCCIGDRFGVKGNDEPIAAHLWRLPRLVLVGALAVPFLVIISLVMREFEGGRRRKAVPVHGFGCTMRLL
jgi:hypothetical protein